MWITVYQVERNDLEERNDLKAFRYITGPDDADYCYRITELLNRGWDLAGPATLTFDHARQRVICGQTLIKEIPELEYTAGIDLESL